MNEVKFRIFCGITGMFALIYGPIAIDLGTTPIKSLEIILLIALIYLLSVMWLLVTAISPFNFQKKYLED